ncbi:ABC transporter permease [Clostridium estertheticum]|uniref:ABC transporter permease n=1 Tax=Clostridium estertheticum TaxID=238834 RepID=UPI0013E96ED8|nr:ABC transporter permease [Clostridium estertheticum]MBZ9688753.1 ABC transporter permease [Clostridium estertheticum]
MDKIEKEQFQHVGKNLAAAQSIKRPSMSYLQDAFRRLKKSKPSIISFWILVVLIIMAIVGPMISKSLYGHTYRTQNLKLQDQTFILSNQRSLKLSSNSVFSYEKYKPNLRKTKLEFKNVKLKNQAGKLSFHIGDKSEESYQGDQKEYKLEITTTTSDNWDSIIKKLNIEAEKILKEDPDFRGVTFKKSNNNITLETKGEKKFNSKYWLGTDDLGRDLFTRLWEGSRVSFLIAIISVLFTVLFGVVYGGVSGYIGGRSDTIMMRIIEILMVIPDMLYIMLLSIVFPRGVVTITLVLAFTSWMGTAILVRGEVLRLKHSEYVIASQILGADSKRVIFKHLIPNCMGPIIVNMTMMIPRMIFAEAFLSFIGLGVPAPYASLGVLVNDGAKIFYQYPHLLIIPSIVLCLIMLSFNILGDGLRDSLDPKLRK